MNENEKVWLITGITGQDGSFLADYLLSQGYTKIHGIIRRSSTTNIQNIDTIKNQITLHYGDLTDGMNIQKIINRVKPDYIVNFAAQSHVKVSEELGNYTFEVNTLGILNILQSVRSVGIEKKCKIYHASTSEMYGNETNGEKLLNEESKMEPVSIYGISKKAAQEICNLYRKAYGMFVVSSILFNHEGTRRGSDFVTQKISNYVARYKSGCEPLQLGNLNARRDWGDAEDYVKAIYKMLQSEQPENYVIATGETHSVREFVELAFGEIGINVVWEGDGIDEKGYDKNRQVIVEVKKEFYRDVDIECLIGDSSKAKRQLGWKPEITFNNLVKKMVKSSKERL